MKITKAVATYNSLENNTLVLLIVAFYLLLKEKWEPEL